MPPLRVLALSASVGAGHDRAAEALAAAAGEMDQIHADWFDSLKYTARLFRKAYAGSYLYMANKKPGLWGYIYQTFDKPVPPATRTLVKIVDRIGYRKLIEAVHARRPDAVVCTHFLPAHVLLARRGAEEAPLPVYVVVTDFDAHAHWIAQEAAGYFAGNDEVKAILEGHGIPASKIHVTGIPIHPLFSKSRPAAEILAELNMPGEGPRVLLMGGGFAVASTADALERLLKIETPYRLLVVSGKNERLRAKLERMSRGDSRVRVFGRVTNVHDLMQVSDLLISKAGGLTVCESLARGLPLVIFYPTPGQEERNSDYLLENGAAVRCNSAAALELKVRRLLADPTKLAAMKSAAAGLGRPQAARDILLAIRESRGS